MMSQRAHRTEDQTLQTRWINGVPYVRDDRGFLIAIPAGGSSNAAPPAAGEDASDDGASGSDDDGSSSGDAGGEGSGDGSDGDEPISRAEYDRLMERMRAADRAKNQKDQELEELRQFKKEMEDKDRSELERAQREAEEATQRVATEAEGRRAAELKLAMVLANGKRDKQFRDSEDVLRWIDADDITDDDGELDPKALTKALDSLAESKPYLLAEPSKTEDEDDEEEEKPGPSGTSQNKDKNKGKGIDKEALARKYPALRGR